MTIAPLLLLGALIYKFIDFLKYVTNKDWNAAGTQAIAWLAGVAGVFLFASTTFARTNEIGGMSFAALGVGDKVFIGLMATSIFSAAYDFKKSFDNNDSAKTPSLFGG